MIYNNHQQKTRLFTILLSTVYCLLSTTLLSAQQLNLPSEDIIGTTQTSHDSLSVSKDISNHYLFDTPQRLSYRAMLDKTIDPKADIPQNGYLYLLGNTNPLADLQLGFYNKKLGHLGADAHYANYDKEKVTFQSYGLKYDHIFSQRDLSAQLGLYGGYNSAKHDTLDLDTDIASLGLYVTLDPKTTPLDKVGLHTNLLLYSFNKTDYFIPEIRFDISATQWEFTSKSELQILWFYNNPHLYANVHFDVPGVDLFAAHLSASRNITPSIMINKNFELGDTSQLSLSNDPLLKATPLKDFQQEYAFSNLDDLRWAEQIPLNAKVAYTLFTPIQLEVYLGGQYIKNHHYVWFIDDATTTTAGWAYDNATLGMFGTNIKKHIEGFTLGFTVKGQVSNLQTQKTYIPGLPHLQLTPSVGYTYKKFNTDLLFDAQLIRYDALKEPIDDALLLRLKNSLDINKHFKIELNLVNILDADTSVGDMPHDGFQAELGLRVLF